MSFDYYCSPIGMIKIEVEGKYIIGVNFTDNDIDLNYEIEDMEAEMALNKCKNQLEEYFSGKRKEFDLDIKFTKGTDFQRTVWEELRKIPYGSTISYKEMAERINNSKACRAVGGANNKNPIGIIVPCHRVIGSTGKMVGYAEGIDKKQYLLKLERDNVK